MVQHNVLGRMIPLARGPRGDDKGGSSSLHSAMPLRGWQTDARQHRADRGLRQIATEQPEGREGNSARASEHRLSADYMNERTGLEPSQARQAAYMRLKTESKEAPSSMSSVMPGRVAVVSM